MPAGGYFYDVVGHPLRDIYDISELDDFDHLFEDYDHPSWMDLPWEDLEEYARGLREGGKFLVGNYLGHILQAGQILRGWNQFVLALALTPVLAEAIINRLTEGHMRAFERYAETVGQHVDVIEVADDLGMQDGLWMSPEMYRKNVKPYHAKLYGFIKEKCDALLFIHSGGSLYPIIPDLIKIGVDIINPVQFTAKDMDLAKLKKDFGDDLCFWGGGINPQHTLPRGTIEEVVDEVKRNLDIMAPGGGFVFGTVHNVTEEVPAENVIPAFRTASDYGQY